MPGDEHRVQYEGADKSADDKQSHQREHAREIEPGPVERRVREVLQEPARDAAARHE